MADPLRPAETLAARVSRTVLMLLMVGGVLVAVSTLTNGRKAARQSYDRILLGAAHDIAESIRIQNGAPFVDLPVSAFALLAQAPYDRIHYSVRDATGKLVTGLDNQVFAPADPVGGARTTFFNARLQGEEARFVHVVRRFAERDYSGAVTVTVGQTLRARQAMALALMWDALFPMAIAGVGLVIAASISIRSAVRPLKSLSANLSQRDPQDLTPIATDGLPRELEVMLVSMNRFMGRLDRQIDAMRNLISDTAHQLRTPVAAILVQAELASTAADDRAQIDPALARLLARTRSLGTLLDQLLSRALVVHRTDSAPRTRIDLRDVALEIIERRDHEVLAPGTEVRLMVEDRPAWVVADEFSVGEAAKNMLNNALKHGKAPVAVGVSQRGDCAELWVQDSGPGPAPRILHEPGRRFARSANSAEDSAGIGLSIVHAVATAFDGKVTLTPGTDGFRIALVLPVDRSEADGDRT